MRSRKTENCCDEVTALAITYHGIFIFLATIALGLFLCFAYDSFLRYCLKSAVRNNNRAGKPENFIVKHEVITVQYLNV
jgi:hypothetical protein